MKYPHTPYFEFSPSADRDDVRKSGYFILGNFLSKRLVITIKMDGSNCQMDCNKIAARNEYSANHPSFDYAKSVHSSIKHLIPDNIILYGEWLYAKHSIHYTGCQALDGFFQLFAVFDKSSEMWLDWESVQHYANILGFVTVPSFSPFESGDDTYLLKDYIIDMGDHCIRNGHMKAL